MGEKKTSNEQNVRSYYMLNHRIIIIYYSTTKKVVILQLASIFLVRVFINILIPSVRMTLTVSKIFARIYIFQTIEWDVNYSTAPPKMLFWLLFSGKRIQNILQFSHSCSFCICQYSPFCKPVKPLDTTVYYGLVFCAFSWPYMVKLVIVDTTAAPALYIAGQ